MKFKQSFEELKRPIIWLHYLIGTLLIYGFFRFIWNIPFVSQITWVGILIFLIVYIVMDRFTHGLLGLV